MQGKLEIIAMVYVDDIITFGDALDGTNQAKAELKSLSKVTDSKPLQYFLSVSSQRMENSILLP